VAFVAGILSFLSPCILPLIPSYVAFIKGMSMEDLTSNKNKKKTNENLVIKVSPIRLIITTKYH
jgi:cytochrome c-type biogenesis protein